jgi:hypothetical protein
LEDKYIRLASTVKIQIKKTASYSKRLKDMTEQKEDKGEPGKQRKLQEIDEEAITKKLNRNILTVFFAMTMLCYIDRTNLAFAALQLNNSLGFTDRVYGLGSGVFFIGYSLFQVNAFKLSQDLY